MILRKIDDFEWVNGNPYSNQLHLSGKDSAGNLFCAEINIQAIGVESKVRHLVKCNYKNREYQSSEINSLDNAKQKAIDWIKEAIYIESL